MKKLKLNKLKNSKFIKAVKEHAPEVLDTIGDYFPPVEVLSNIIKNVDQNKQDQIKLAHAQDLESFALEVQDRESARNLFINDSVVQKILAVVFTVAYFVITKILIDHFFGDEAPLKDYELGFLSSLFGAMSAKVNTIIDFFFGGSVK